MAGESSKVARSASVVGIAVLLSRVLGLVRELIFAAFFGAGAVFDAFVTAFRIPNLFRDLFAEGALSAAFVKTFSQKLERDGEKDAWRLASLVITFLLLVVGAVTLLGVLAAPWIVDAIAPGFDAEKKDLSVHMTRIMFPFLMMVTLSAVAMGILNTRGKFGVPALASSFFNIGSIVGGLLVGWLVEPAFMEEAARAVFTDASMPRDGAAAMRAIVGMAVGVMAGGACQFLMQVPSLVKTGFRFTPSVAFRDPGLRDVLVLMGPAVLGIAAVQINVFVNTNFASRLEDGAVSWLNYAFRLMQFPIGIFGVAIATATLPSIARSAARQNPREFGETLTASLRLALFLTIPSAIGLIVLGVPIIALVYERGSFTAGDSLETAGALAYYAIGLIGYSLIKILAPAFYALDDARTPARVSVLSIVTNIVLCWLLVGPLGHRGLALSTATVATANALLLLFLLKGKGAQIPIRSLAFATLRIGIASGVLAVTCWFAMGQLSAVFSGEHLGARSAVVFGSMAVGGVAFFVSCAVLRVEEMRRLGSLLRSRR